MTLQLTSISSLQNTVRAWRAAGGNIAFVPTMGALHAGHLALMAEAKKHAKHVVVSIFVNPTQFGPKEDFNRYPRPLEEDLEKLRAGGVDAVWLPSVEDIYPTGLVTDKHVAGISEELDGAFRPGHFDGVATVVARLFSHVRADVALFGEKDYQQLSVIKQLVVESHTPIKVIGVPTVREADGLALSSRNRYLSDSERKIAPKMHEYMVKAAKEIRAGMDIGRTLNVAKQSILASGFDRIDYLELREEETLVPITNHLKPVAGRLLAAVWLGSTRLIDNVKVE